MAKSIVSKFLIPFGYTICSLSLFSLTMRQINKMYLCEKLEKSLDLVNIYTIVFYACTFYIHIHNNYLLK